MKILPKFFFILLLLVFSAHSGLVGNAKAQEFTMVPFADVELIIQPSPDEDVVMQLLYMVDIGADELYVWRLAKNATSFVIEAGYMHPGKQYKLYMVAVNADNIPSDSSNARHLQILGFEIPAERIPPQLFRPSSSGITEIK